jgi:hypothetical protein
MKRSLLLYVISKPQTVLGGEAMCRPQDFRRRGRPRP